MCVLSFARSFVRFDASNHPKKSQAGKNTFNIIITVINMNYDRVNSDKVNMILWHMKWVCDSHNMDDGIDEEKRMKANACVITRWMKRNTLNTHTNTHIHLEQINSLIKFNMLFVLRTKERKRRITMKSPETKRFLTSLRQFFWSHLNNSKKITDSVVQLLELFAAPPIRLDVQHVYDLKR